MATFEPSPDLDPAVAQAIQQAMDALRAELLPRLASRDVASAAGPAERAAGGDVHDRLQWLEQAVEALDAATSQTSLLSELLQQAGRFADRALFLVLEGSRFTGWAAYGFDTDQEHVTGAEVDADGSAWERVAKGAAVVELSGDACIELVEQLEGEPALGGILVAFALRGSTAGALYADRIRIDGALDPSALRILSYVASQALETLPLRHARQPAPVADAPSPAVTEPTGDEGVAATAEVDVDEMIQEVTAAGSAEQDILEIRRADSAPTLEPAVEPRDAEMEETGVETLAQEIEAPEPESTDIELPVIELPGPEDALDTESEDFGLATQEISTLESTLGGDVLDEPAPRLPEGRTLEPAEVAPPADLEGPGWAFGGSGKITDDTRHEEARRLARLLVTEIKLYNEEKVRLGRENNNLVDQLRDDLERSRRIYEERIDEEIRIDTDYFNDECVRILAGGDAAALGS